MIRQITKGEETWYFVADDLGLPCTPGYHTWTEAEIVGRLLEDSDGRAQIPAGESIEATTTVTVKICHATSIPGCVWVEPVGWEPAVGQFGENIIFDGAAWDDHGEVAGIAAAYSDLGTSSPQECTECLVAVSDLFWLFSGDCHHAGPVQMETQP
jgi:hypothetical protein